MCPKILKNSLTGLKIGRDTRMWLENRRKGLRGGIGTDERRKAVKEIGREKQRAFRPLWLDAGVHVQEHPLLRELVPGIRAGDNRQSDVVVRGLRLGRGLPVVGDMCMMSALHQDGSPWAGADDYDGVAIERGIAAKHSTYPELVSSDRVKFLVLA